MKSMNIPRRPFQLYGKTKYLLTASGNNETGNQL